MDDAVDGHDVVRRRSAARAQRAEAAARRAGGSSRPADRQATADSAARPQQAAAEPTAQWRATASSVRYVRTPLLLAAWAFSVHCAAQVGMGLPYVLASAIAAVFTVGLSDEHHPTPGERMSAWSVFNTRGRSMMGSLNSNHLVDQITHQRGGGDNDGEAAATGSAMPVCGGHRLGGEAG